MNRSEHGQPPATTAHNDRTRPETEPRKTSARQVLGLVAQIQASTAMSLGGDARHAAIAVMRALAPRLEPGAATDRLHQLLDALVRSQLAEEPTVPPEAAVMRELGVSATRAAEITRAVIVALIETFGDQAGRLIAALPESLRPIGLGALSGAGAEGSHTPGLGSTLGEGRPGSRHPIAGARPTRAQSQSIAASDDPHAVTRISSTEGLPAERRGKTLADVQHPSERALAGGTEAAGDEDAEDADDDVEL